MQITAYPDIVSMLARLQTISTNPLGRHPMYSVRAMIIMHKAG